MKKIIFTKLLLIFLLNINNINGANSNIEVRESNSKTTFVDHPRLFLQLTEDGTTTETRIVYIAGQTEGLDPGYDAGAFISGSPTLAIYTHLPCDSKGIDFTINTLPLGFDESIVIPISVTARAAKTITFGSRINSDFPAGQEYYLEDRENNTFNKISDGSVYNVTTTTALSGVGRFFLHTAKIAWLGTTNSDWNIASNWSNNLVPSATDTVLITNNGVNPIITGSLVVNNVIVASGASLTVDNNLTINGLLTIKSDPYISGSLIVKGTSTGTITYKRDVSFYKSNVSEHKGWHLFGPPVVTETIEDIIANGNLLDNTAGTFKGLAAYNNNQTYASSNGWVYQTASSTGVLNSGQGYSVRRKEPCYIPISGTLKTDDLIGYPLTVGTRNAWNLISNPYASFVNANTVSDSFLSLNSNQLDASSTGLYIWDSEANNGEGEYLIINYSSPDYYLNPGQGFFVKSKAGGGAISILEAMQTHKPETAFSRSANKYTEVSLFISDENSTKRTDIKYGNTNVSEGLDVGYDASTFNQSESEFSIATHLVKNSNGKDFMLQALPKSSIESIIVPIAIYANSGKTITFTAETKELTEGLNVILEDRKNNTFTTLNLENASYALTLEEKQNGIGRFYMHASANNALDILDADNNTINMYISNNNTLRITGVQNTNISIQGFNVLGKTILNKTYTNNESVLDVNLNGINKGIYLFSVITEKGKFLKKIILN
jgi:hypothetical protein